jgi:hypothetical protein
LRLFVVTLEEALAAVQKVRDCPATRRLCLDCWTWAKEHGEEMGLQMARMLLDGVERYEAHGKNVKRLASWLPPAPPPSSSPGTV